MLGYYFSMRRTAGPATDAAGEPTLTQEEDGEVVAAAELDVPLRRDAAGEVTPA